MIKTSAEQLATMTDFVREMHVKSGLLAELEAAETTMAQAEQQILDYVKKHVPVSRKAPLAGNTIGTDRTFLAKEMPSSRRTCTTATWTSAASRSWPAAGTPRPSTKPR